VSQGGKGKHAKAHGERDRKRGGDKPAQQIVASARWLESAHADYFMVHLFNCMSASRREKPNNDTCLVAGRWDTVFASEADHFAGEPVQFEAVTRLKVVRHRGLHHWRKTCHRTLKLCRKGRRKHDAGRMTNGHCLETEKSPLPGALRARQPRGSCRRVMPHTSALTSPSALRSR